MANLLDNHSEEFQAERLIAIGDIHGHAELLAQLLKAIVPNATDTIVILGDCIDRGPGTREVIDQLIVLSRICKLACILGNHEEMMLEARTDQNAQQRWESQGGFEALLSYGENGKLENISREHWGFLEGFVPYYETEEFLFVHANYNWYTPMNEQPASLLRWTSIEDSPPKAHISGKTVILGHSPGPIRDLGFCVCIDTGCGFGGSLTALEVNTGVEWSVQVKTSSLRLTS